MKLADVVSICIRTQRRRLGLAADAPVRPEDREAMESVLAVAAAHNPSIMSLIEEAKGVAVADELRAQRAKRERAALAERARPIVEAVAREASVATGGDVTPGLLLARTGRGWLTQWRQEAWTRLARAELTHEEIGLLFGRAKSQVGRGIAQREERVRAERTAEERTVNHGA